MTSRVLGILFLLAMMGCASTSSSTSTGNGRASEDNRKAETKGGTATLVETKKYLPTFPAAPAGSAAPAAPATPTNHLRSQVNLLLDSVVQVQKNIKYATGYRILAYTGIERNTAMTLRNNLIQRLPEEKDYLTYKQPTYQLKFGDFFTRVEAQAALSKVQDLLPNALLVRETINIPK
ncbi:MAG: sporulation protein [Rufibacter sp.]